MPGPSPEPPIAWQAAIASWRAPTLNRLRPPVGASLLAMSATRFLSYRRLLPPSNDPINPRTNCRPN